MDTFIKSMMLVLFVFGMVACGSPEVKTTEVESDVVVDTTTTGTTVDETTDTEVSVEDVVPAE
jgi:uncharacterized protein YcfL